MKIVAAACVSLALIASSAAAETAYRSTMSGTVKIEMKDAKGQAAPKAGESLTIEVVQPPKVPDEEDAAQRLKACGDKWNKKVDAYEKRLRKIEQDTAYRNAALTERELLRKKAGDALTRASYRACMYACLGETPDDCPGGWAVEQAAASGSTSGAGASSP